MLTFNTVKHQMSPNLRNVRLILCNEGLLRFSVNIPSYIVAVNGFRFHFLWFKSM